MRGLLRTITLPLEVGVRAQQIGMVFSRYGLAEGLGALGIEVGKRGLNVAGVGGKPDTKLDAVFGKKLAKLCVKLGPTFIKLGQVLATRPDLVGDPVAEQLKVLFDRVPPIAYSKIQKILRRELGTDRLRTAFRSIETKPLASASLGQTHRAVLADGSPVILKVQKPGVGDVVRVDLVILETFARSLHVLHPRLQLLPIFLDFKQATLREIDYREEAKNIARFRKNHRSLFSKSDVMFPRYFPDLTTERVLVLEPMHGSKVSDLRKGSTVARNAASIGLASILEQIFDHGFFHADPHAGNLFFMEDEGRLGFIDLGLVGQLEPEDKRRFLKVLMAILNRDRERLAKALFDLGKASKKTDYKKFEQGVQALLDEAKAKGIENVRLDQMVNQLLNVARRNGIVIPNRYILMIRSCLVIEGVAKSLDPKISMFKVATPIVARSLIKTYNPLHYIKKLF